jgi:hypothetical protein
MVEFDACGSFQAAGMAHHLSHHVDKIATPLQTRKKTALP